MSSGNYIRDRRKEKGLTQEDLAELAGCNVRTVRRLETEGCVKETNTIKKILEILEVRTSRIDNKGRLVLKFEADEDDNEEILNELGCNNSNEVFNALKNNLIQAYQLVEKKNYYEALEIYLAVSKLFVNEKIHLKIAILYYNMGRYEECIDASNKLINGQSYIYEGLNIKGICLSKLLKYEESLEILKEALEIKGDYIDYYNLGVTYGIKGDTYKAIK
ncbi:helix-turn-helix domain-containing protein [Clostridium butyricum]|uniref:helix-turn-helix domain-containing protein n=1 Tax=Clostridium butyricum TaxID=1492 RepID=UPI00090410D6|nr:helix-turn-helix domain-containing protein [Clostridium butyricum]APF23652.1 helix-turn-helix family protein [Clostridium butyricum]